MRAAENALSSRHEAWRRSERTYRVFVDPQEIQGPQEIIQTEVESLYTYPTSIVVPLSFAITQTLVAFWMTLFTTDKPYLRVGWMDQDSEGPARAQELLLQQQLGYNGYELFLYQWLLDAVRYGLSPAKIGWDNVYRNQTVRRFMDFPGPEGPLRFQLSHKERVLEYEGNTFEVIDPFSWRPDNRWPTSQFQRGNYCGESMYRSYYELKRWQDLGIYQHVDEVPKKTSPEYFRDSVSDRERITQTNNYFGTSFENYGSDSLNLVEEVTLDLIPDEHDLSSSTDVERWIVTLVNRTVIVRAEPFPFDHNDYPYALLESSPDRFAFVNPGLIEIMEPVHQHITWFLNSMIENARKSLNDRLVVDPDVVNMDDVLKPSAGKVIRINSKYWGFPNIAKGAVFPLPVSDVNAQNYKHVGFLIDLVQKISAANDTIQGQLSQEDRSATEVAGASQQGAQRLRMLGKIFSAQGLVPLTKQLVQNNMQLLSQETYVKTVGGLEQEYQGIGRAISGNGIQISPADIQGLFHFPVSDASSPLDPVRFARTWVQIMQVTLQNPAMAQQVNLGKVWSEMVKGMGVNDPSRLLLPQVQVMPDQQLAAQVQQGNLVPTGQQQGPPQAPPPRNSVPNVQTQSVQGEDNRPQGQLPQAA